jgi:hypothetical protein
VGFNEESVVVAREAAFGDEVDWVGAHLFYFFLKFSLSCFLFKV